MIEKLQYELIKTLQNLNQCFERLIESNDKLTKTLEDANKPKSMKKKKEGE